MKSDTTRFEKVTPSTLSVVAPSWVAAVSQRWSGTQRASSSMRRTLEVRPFSSLLMMPRRRSSSARS